MISGLYDEGSVILINKPFTPLSGLQRDKLEKYAEINDLDISRVVYFRDDAIPFLADEADIIDFTDINSVEMPKKPRTKRAEASKIAQEAKFEYWEYDATGYGRLKHGTIDPTKTILYIRGKRTDPWYTKRILSHIADPNVVLVHVEVTREKLLLRGFPTAAQPQAYIAAKVAEMTAALTDEDWSLADAGASLNHVSWLRSRTDDPTIAAIYQASKRDAFSKFARFMSNAGLDYTVPDTVVTYGDYISENYPLINRYHEAESIEYINMVYALRNNGKES